MFANMTTTLSQLWPPAPRFTEKDVGDQSDKVFVVTGSSSGVGKELARILFSLNGTVYLAARTEAKANAAIDDIRSSTPESTGAMHFLHIDLEDLGSVKEAAETFLKRESRLDGLWHNAGVMQPPAGSVSKQGHELQLAVHCLSPFLLTSLLTPTIIRTARCEKPGAARVMWVASSAAELFSPPGGVDMDNLDYKRDTTASEKYAISKAGMVLLSQEYARRHKPDGIISVAMNPGNLKSDLGRYFRRSVATFFRWISWDPVYGAYTELFSGFSPDINMENSGCWVIPWGRISPVRQDILDSRAEEVGGNGLGVRFWEWCETQTQAFRA